MKALFLVSFLLTTYAVSGCSGDDLFCISNVMVSDSVAPQSNGQLIGEGVQSAIAGYSQVSSLLDEAATRRYNRYSPAPPPKGYGPEQIEQFRQDHQRRWKQEQEIFNRKVSETFRVPDDIKKSFQEVHKRQKAVIDTLRSIRIPEPKIPEPAYTKPEGPVLDSRGLLKDAAESHPVVRETLLNTHRLSGEGKEIRGVINKALVLEGSDRREFIIRSVLRADYFFGNPDVNSPRAAQRWLERAKSAYTYWTDQPEKARLMLESLNQNAKTAFGLENIPADTFERYEIIRAAKLLSFESKLMEDDQLRFQATLSLKQALIYAENGDTDFVVRMTENVYAIKDFLRGFTGGFKQNSYDSLTGLWGTVSHPIDSAEAIADALMNYEETFDFIASRVETIINEYGSYTPAQKGELFGKISSELFTSTLLPAGSVKSISKLTEALNIGKKIWTASARLKKYQLPTRGHIRFVPPKNYHPGTELPRGPNRGYIDRSGNEWCEGKTRTLGENFEWDVQLGKHATDGMRKYATKNNVVNVSLKGKVTH